MGKIVRPDGSTVGAYPVGSANRGLCVICGEEGLDRCFVVGPGNTPDGVIGDACLECVLEQGSKMLKSMDEEQKLGWVHILQGTMLDKLERERELLGSEAQAAEDVVLMQDVLDMLAETEELLIGTLILSGQYDANGQPLPEDRRAHPAMQQWKSRS